MRISTRGRYGVRALEELALHYGEGPLLIKDIAKNQGISQYYLEQIILVLKAAGVVKSIRGSKGGITLARPPYQIKLSEALQVLEGSVAPVECVDDIQACSRSAFCVSRDIWVEMKQAIDQILQSKTLQDLVDQHKKKGQPESEMYYI